MDDIKSAVSQVRAVNGLAIYHGAASKCKTLLLILFFLRHSFTAYLGSTIIPSPPAPKTYPTRKIEASSHTEHIVCISLDTNASFGRGTFAYVASNADTAFLHCTIFHYSLITHSIF